MVLNYKKEEKNQSQMSQTEGIPGCCMMGKLQNSVGRSSCAHENAVLESNMLGMKEERNGCSWSTVTSCSYGKFSICTINKSVICYRAILHSAKKFNICQTLKNKNLDALPVIIQRRDIIPHF